MRERKKKPDPDLHAISSPNLNDSPLATPNPIRPSYATTCFDRARDATLVLVVAGCSGGTGVSGPFLASGDESHLPVLDR